MKIRWGFVANSSSSDYVVYTYRCNNCDWEGETDAGEFSIGLTKCINGHLICKSCLGFDIYQWVNTISPKELIDTYECEIKPYWKIAYPYITGEIPGPLKWSTDYIHRIMPPSICPVCKDEIEQNELVSISQRKIINKSIQCVRFLEELEYENT
jgi:hypothetical protein